MSNLSEIRELFIKSSGAYQLVSNPTTFADAGANKIIQAGQRLLDKALSLHELTRSYLVDVAAGEYGIEVPGLRFVTSVWAINNNGRVKLEKKSSEELRESFPSLSDIDAGTPTYYCRGIRLAPAVTTFTYGNESVVSGSPTGSHSIAWLPQTDSTYTIEVLGKFWSSLVEDSDTSFWSSEHEELLILAAQYILEAQHYRNSTGAQAILTNIYEGLNGLAWDDAEESWAERQALGG